MADRKDTLQKYVGDMLALERHIHNAVRRQKDDDHVKQHPEASRVINKIDQTLHEHIEHLEHHLTSLGGDPTSLVKEAASAVAGVAAGLYDKVRTEEVSKMLRDDYTALGLAAISYTMLHTTGLALNDHQTASISLHHLEHWTPLIVEISEIIPRVVAKELADDGMAVNASVAQEAVRNTQQLWSREVVQ